MLSTCLSTCYQLVRMVSLFVNPLTFDNKKNEILYSSHKIEWKKQVATVSLKKGLLPEAFINEKILSKLDILNPLPNTSVLANRVLPNTSVLANRVLPNTSVLANRVLPNTSVLANRVFAKFKYIPESGKNNEIYLACLPSENSKITTDLYYESHIPANSQILIIEDQKKNITKHSQYLRVKGNVLAFCLNVSTYYLEVINLDEYIEFVQMENNEANQDEECFDLDEEYLDSNEEDLEDEDLEEDPDEEDLEEEDLEDEDLDDEDLDDEELDEEDLEEAEEDNAIEEDAEEDNAIEEDAVEEDAAEEEAEEEAEDEAEEALDDEENTIGGVEELDDEPSEPKPSQSINKRKKPGSSKSIKFNAGLDTSILFNILKKEDEKNLIPDAQLHLKRNITIKILTLLELPVKTIQFIEKGIYNYVIEKCSANSIIPIWENPEFNDMYVSKSKSIYSNLNIKCYVGNKDLLEKVKKGKINAYDLAFLESHKLYPEKWNDIIEEKAKMDKMLKESLKESATDLFQCTRCKKRKTIYCEVQTRSSDEPMTKFITCLECGYKWKQY